MRGNARRAGILSSLLGLLPWKWRGRARTYVTKSGKTLDEDAVRTRIKVGVPVHVHYVGEGDNMLVDRVVLDED